MAERMGNFRSINLTKIFRKFFWNLIGLSVECENLIGPKFFSIFLSKISAENCLFALFPHFTDKNIITFIQLREEAIIEGAEILFLITFFDYIKYAINVSVILKASTQRQQMDSQTATRSGL